MFEISFPRRDPSYIDRVGVPRLVLGVVAVVDSTLLPWLWRHSAHFGCGFVPFLASFVLLPVVTICFAAESLEIAFGQIRSSRRAAPHQAPRHRNILLFDTVVVLVVGTEVLLYWALELL